MPTKTQVETNKHQQNKAGNPVVWVEVPVNDLERAKTFYGSVFGFKFQMHEMEDYKMAMFTATPDGYGCGGALMQGETYVPSYEGAAVYFSTPDIEATLKKVSKAGGQTVLEKKSIGEYGFIAFFEDSEGNRVALHTMG